MMESDGQVSLLDTQKEMRDNKDGAKLNSGNKLSTKKRKSRSSSSKPPRNVKKRRAIDTVDVAKEQPALIVSFLTLDPILQFLTRMTGKILVPLPTLYAALPPKLKQQDELLLQHIPELAERGVLQLSSTTTCLSNWTDANAGVGFPPPPTHMDDTNTTKSSNGDKLHGSTKSAAKRRLAALKRSLKQHPETLVSTSTSTTASINNERNSGPKEDESDTAEGEKSWDRPPSPEEEEEEEEEDNINNEDIVILEDEREGRKAVTSMLKVKQLTRKQAKALKDPSRHVLDHILPRQAAYSGSNPARKSDFALLPEHVDIPAALLDAFGIQRPKSRVTLGQRKKKLYSHQVRAIESALFLNRHTLVCTGTGSGKSLCFLLPVLAVAVREHEHHLSSGSSQRRTSLIMFPTKALAQDQMTKLLALLASNPELAASIRPGIIDGDVSQAQRAAVAKSCNIILTNPDTLHAAILPGWKGMYRPILERVHFVVIDEAHMYDGVFGAHVAMVLSRLMRLCIACGNYVGSHCNEEQRGPVFLACSATMSHPEHHFRLLVPIPKHAEVQVITPEDDGSPRAAKHFFVWNPPIIDTNGVSTGCVTPPKTTHDAKSANDGKVNALSTSTTKNHLHKAPSNGNVGKKLLYESESVSLADALVPEVPKDQQGEATTSRGWRRGLVNGMQIYRRHSADETALLLARAVTRNVRCIAFCKTRCLVEWVYERTIQALKSDPATADLTTKVESYRGGYTADVRRSIEQRLFKNELRGVIGTSALELGVDIGGIDLTLHCGYPSSYASLLQQAGRAGRGAARASIPSVAIMVCFNAPAEQHIWRKPKNLLVRGKTAPISMPVNAGLVRGHLLCAGAEYALTGKYPVTKLFQTYEDKGDAQVAVLNDYDLFGSKDVFLDAVDSLHASGLVKVASVAVTGSISVIDTIKTHPFVDKPWTKVNLRSIEPVQYAIVDLSHPLQGGQMTSAKDESVVLDTIPYSRVFYHAFPGAIITHRGQRYKVQSMTRPPAFASECSGYRGGEQLAAFAKPTSARYMTRPLSNMHVTVVKQMERVDLLSCRGHQRATNESEVPRAKADEAANVEAQADEQSSVAVAESIPTPYADEEEVIIGGSLAGNGAITVRRTVHGYKKLSPITRVELSRSELSLPAMEFDTYGFWLDADASRLSPFMKNFGEGVHALSHAILAVAPMFVPCADSDLNCDHSYIDCTRVMIFDMRAGGSGTSAQLWKFLFQPDGLMDAVIELLEDCTTCKHDRGYDGGCPACLHFSQCLKFNQNLSKSAALVIAKRINERLKKTELFKQNETSSRDGEAPASPSRNKGPSLSAISPRRTRRERAFRRATDLESAKERQIVVGRPGWPAEDSEGIGGRQEEAD